MNKLQILQASLKPRNDEILNYQINIDNYTLAIDKIDAQYADNSDLIEFRDKLTTEVKNHKTEQLKSIIIRDVITDQINELETKSITEETVRESLETLVTNDAHA